ncbi:hypothetical protein SUGI_1045220 [Cryptomeria japonica]|uniref:uncharacterized protein LOC131075638 n=1 Tax=Cryptomeria japonica TaxID=3369 RepID=UPI002414B46F|nr:uncharacterized protein LOC131075638 [Cryptomeria japonica]GLJ49394.1 hypothetical protein SUGI_1045220 [Cryptomeria japonica]
MDPNSKSLHSTVDQDDNVDEWDADGFEIPCLKLDSPGSVGRETGGAKETNFSSQQVKALEEEIYLGPHGAPPSVVKQQEHNSAGKKQRFKHKLKLADKKGTIGGRENKVENLRELIGGKGGMMAPRGSPREWLDPHCHESQFEHST